MRGGALVGGLPPPWSTVAISRREAKGDRGGRARLCPRHVRLLPLGVARVAGRAALFLGNDLNPRAETQRRRVRIGGDNVVHTKGAKVLLACHHPKHRN